MPGTGKVCDGPHAAKENKIQVMQEGGEIFTTGMLNHNNYYALVL